MPSKFAMLLMSDLCPEQGHLSPFLHKCTCLLHYSGVCVKRYTYLIIYKPCSILITLFFTAHLSCFLPVTHMYTYSKAIGSQPAKVITPLSSGLHYRKILFQQLHTDTDRKNTLGSLINNVKGTLCV